MNPPSLRGTTCIVTGGSQGIGRCTALGLARLDARVVIVSRDPERAEAARAAIVEESGNRAVECQAADLSSQASVRDLAERLNRTEGRLGVLVNNAAVASPVRQTTVDGLERQFAINHLAPFLLTNLLKERLVADAPARVVNVSSWIHAQGTIDFADLQGERGYTGVRAYNQSKLANVLFTYELARRWADLSITVNCLHPGSAATSLNNFLRPKAGQGSLVSRVRQGLRRRLHALRGGAGPPTPEDASRTSLFLASSPEVEGIGGEYFVNCERAQSSEASRDPELAARLWQVSEELTGLRSH